VTETESTNVLALGSAGTRVLLVGTGTHVSGSKLPDIPAVAATVQDLAAVLVERCGLRPENLCGPLIDPQDQGELGDAIMTAAAKATDVFLLYYVGHGLVSAGNELYLATAATDDEFTGLAFKALPYQAIRDVLTDCPARSIIVVLDCCFAGKAHGSFGTAANAFELASQGGTYLLASASEHEQALAPVGDEYTAFTGELLTLLRMGDPTGLPEITVEDAYRHLARALPRRQIPEPVRYLSGRAGDLVLTTNPVAVLPATNRWPDDQAATPGSAQPCPYRGLDPFTASDARFFFGRDELIADVLARLAEWADSGGPIAMVGVSGAGKSSLLQAGLLPAVARDELGVLGSGSWPHMTLMPGRRPLETLAARLATPSAMTREAILAELRADPTRLVAIVRASLRRSTAVGGRLLLVVDQFEELFTLCQDESERRAFVQALCAAGASAALVVLSVRADFYARCMAYPELVEVLTDRQIPVTPMTPEQIQAAIEQPARVAGLALEAGLTDRLLHDLGTNDTFAGPSLPLLSYALQMTWARRAGPLLTLAGYEATGGIWNAVTRQADLAYDGLDPAGQRALRTMLLRMVYLGEGTEDTRRTVDLTELLAEHPDDAVALGAARDALAGRGLIALDEDTAQIAHDALLWAWPRLRRWIEEDRGGLLVHQQLTDVADDWQRNRRDRGRLYRGAKLTTAQRWSAEHAALLRPTDREFLRASLDLRRRGRMLVLGAVVMLVVAAVAAPLAIVQSRDAAAEAALIASRQIALRADAIRDADPAAAQQLSLAAYRIAPTPEASASLLTSFTTPYPVALAGHTKPVVNLAYNSDGQVLASSAGDHTLRLWDVADPRHPAARAVLEPGGTAAIAFVPHRGVLVGQTANALRLWDIRDPSRPVALAGVAVEPVETFGLAVSPDGTTVATASAGGLIRLWNITDPRRPVLDATRTIDAQQVDSIAFSPDGKTLATGSGAAGPGADQARVRLWNVTEPRQPVVGAVLPVDSALGLGFNPHGTLLVSVGAHGSARIWDVTNPDNPVRQTDPQTVGGGRADLRDVVFSPDGNTFVTADSSGTIDRWSIGDLSGVSVASQLPGTSPEYADALSPDGETVVGAGADGAVRVWTSPNPPVLPGKLLDFGDPFSTDGGVIALDATLWNVADPHHPVRAATLPQPWSSAAFLPNSRTLISLNDDRSMLGLWDATDPAHPVRESTFSDVLDVSFSDDRHALALYRKSVPVIDLWDISDPRRPHRTGDISDPSQGGPNTPVGALFLNNTILLVQDAAGNHLWDVRDMHRPVHASDLPSDLQFDHTVSGAGGASLVAWAENQPISVFDLTNPRHPVTVQVPGIEGDATGAVFLDDHTLAASTANDHAVHLWDFSDPGHPHPLSILSADNIVTDLIGSADGRTLVGSTGFTGRLPMWQKTAQGWVEQGSLSYHNWDVDQGVAIRSDSSVAAIGVLPNDEAQGVLLADLQPDRIHRYLCSINKQSITRDQWQRYLPDQPFQPPCA
jgi:WD40 repeat protein